MLLILKVFLGNLLGNLLPFLVPLGAFVAGHFSGKASVQLKINTALLKETEDDLRIEQKNLGSTDLAILKQLHDRDSRGSP